MSSTSISNRCKMGSMAVIVSDAARAAFAKQLKAWREKRGITQHDLSMELGCSFATVSKWEQEAGYPRALHIRRILKKITGLDVDEIARKFAGK